MAESLILKEHFVFELYLMLNTNILILKYIIHMLTKILKGYLRYKTMTSQNVLSEAQVMNFSIL